MKKIFIALSLMLLLCNTVLASDTCFIARDNQKVLKKEGDDCNKRFAPASTFKIALSLMGFDSGIFKDRYHPEWPWKMGYDSYVQVCKKPHNPRTWMRDSCVWYSQLLTQKLGMERFKGYVDAFHYGNQDVSGDKGKNNGLTHAWLSSSLAISAAEQVEFLQKMLDKKLPINPKAVGMTKENMYLMELSGGWKLYGKTGTGNQQGWFTGWMENNGRIIFFVNHISDRVKKDTLPSFRARNDTLIKLWYLIEELEKDTKEITQ